MAENNIDTNTEISPNEKLVESIKRFTAAYKALNAPGKVAFQNQIIAQMKNMDERTKALYQALLEATKNEYNIEKTIKEMEHADKVSKAGI